LGGLWAPPSSEDVIDEESAKKAKDAASQALETAEKCRQIEEDTKKMIAEFEGAGSS